MEPISTIGAAKADGKRNRHAHARAVAMLAGAIGFAALVSGCVTQHPVVVKDTSRTFTTVVIDPGHGGKDSGTFSRGRRGPLVLEKVAALDVARRLDTKLKAAGFRTVMTRQTDIFIPLEERAAISNRQTNAIYVSIHFNDSPRRRIHGIETYYHSDFSIPLAEKIESNLDSMPGESDRGVKYCDFHVLRKNQYPAVLVECGFLSNKSEAVRAASPDYRQHLADKIADAIYQQRYGSDTHPQAVTAKAQGAQSAPPPEAGL